VALGTVGTTAFGPWYRGLGGFWVPAGAAPVEDPDATRAARNAALGAVAAILLGLAGATVGADDTPPFAGATGRVKEGEKIDAASAPSAVSRVARGGCRRAL
jgi:hypothetical protein